MIGLIRTAAIVLIAFLLYRMVKKWLAKAEASRKSEQKKIGTMVRCHHCALHLPENEAIEKNHHWYCSEEHARKDNP